MMKRITSSLLVFCMTLGLGAGCKPVGEDGEVSTTATGGYQEITAGDHLIWSLATYLKKGVSADEKKLAKHIGVSGKELFFSSKSDPLYPKVSAAETKNGQAAGVKASVKAFMAKEKLRLATNLEVSTSANLKVVATWWMDVVALTKRLTLNGNHTVEFTAQAALTDSDANVKPSINAGIKAFGVDLKSYTATTSKPMQVQVPMPKLEASPIIYGVPEAGFTAEIGLKPVVKFSLDLDVRVKHILSMTLIPHASVVAHIGAGAKASKALTAKALGELDIVAGEWPFSLSIGGSKSQNLLYGGATYDGQNFQALKGRLVLVAKVGAIDGVLPLGLDKYLWMGIQALFKKAGISLPNIYKEWEFRHVIWESPPLVLKKSPGYAGKAFYKIFNNADGSKCKVAQAVVQNHLAALKKDAAGDSTSLKEVSNSITALLTKVDTKIKAGCKATGAAAPKK